MNPEQGATSHPFTLSHARPTVFDTSGTNTPRPAYLGPTLASAMRRATAPVEGLASAEKNYHRDITQERAPTAVGMRLLKEVVVEKRKHTLKSKSRATHSHAANAIESGRKLAMVKKQEAATWATPQNDADLSTKIDSPEPPDTQNPVIPSKIGQVHHNLPYLAAIKEAVHELGANFVDCSTRSYDEQASSVGAAQDTVRTQDPGKRKEPAPVAEHLRPALMRPRRPSPSPPPLSRNSGASYPTATATAGQLHLVLMNDRSALEMRKPQCCCTHTQLLIRDLRAENDTLRLLFFDGFTDDGGGGDSLAHLDDGGRSQPLTGFSHSASRSGSRAGWVEGESEVEILKSALEAVRRDRNQIYGLMVGLYNLFSAVEADVRGTWVGSAVVEKYMMLMEDVEETLKRRGGKPNKNISSG